MGMLSVVEFVTLDGVMQSLGSPDEDRDGGFPYGGWGAAYEDEVLAEKAAAGLPATTAYLFGRRTYEKMAAYWPFEPDENPIAAHLNATPKYVATRTLADLEWPGSHIIKSDLVQSVGEIKAQYDGTITVLGSGVLVQSLIEHDLIDRYRVFVHPLVLGTGKRLFRAVPRPLRLRLCGCTPTTTGVLLLDYERASPTGQDH